MTLRAHLGYAWYVLRHKWFVFVAGLHTEAWRWYRDNRSRILLEPETRMLVESVLARACRSLGGLVDAFLA